MSNFDISTLPISMLKPGESVHGAYCNIEKGERGGGGVGYQQKRCFLKLRKDADRKRLFCSNVSTLLSMIADLDLMGVGGRGWGGGFDLLALVAFLPSFVTTFLPKIRGSGPPDSPDPALDPQLRL